MYMDIGLKVLKHIFGSLFTMTYYVALNEFICSQRPQSMKDILIGTSFTVQGIFHFIGNVGVMPVLILESRTQPFAVFIISPPI